MKGDRETRAYGLRTWIVNLTALVGLAMGMVAVADAAAQEPPKLVVLGDSLTAGYGLPQEQAFPVRLEAWLKQNGVNVKVINAGVSGDTSAGGLSRLDWAIGVPPAPYAIVALGANDGLRGLSPAALEQNIDRIVERLKARNVKVLLAGMYAPRNYGRDYASEFDGAFERVARRHGVPLYPFFLDGVAAEPGLNQGDGIHPNARGVEVMVERIGPHVRRLLAGG
jgi:acyl-CoA thioesterase I